FPALLIPRAFGSRSAVRPQETHGPGTAFAIPGPGGGLGQQKGRPAYPAGISSRPRGLSAVPQLHPGVPAPALIQASIVTSIRFGSISGFFGTVIVTTPCWLAAVIFSGSTPRGSGTDR